MYRITFPNGETAITEKPNFIRVHSNGCFVLCDRKNADGVAHKGTAYLYKDGAMITEFDGGDEMNSQKTSIDGIIKTILEG